MPRPHGRPVVTLTAAQRECLNRLRAALGTTAEWLAVDEATGRQLLGMALVEAQQTQAGKVLFRARPFQVKRTLETELTKTKEGEGLSWSIVQSDCIEFFRGQPEGSIDLVFGSPPYADARTYDDGSLPPGAVTVRDCQEWVDWMLEVTTAAIRVSKGLVLWVVSGVQRDLCYWPGCEGLAWEWWKRGNQLWRPVIWWKVDENEGGSGIPGSGGKQWLRNDWEYVLAFKREGWLPYADPLVMGHEPVIDAVGGRMSNRTADGRRINEAAHAQGKRAWNADGGTRRANGVRKKVKRDTMDAPGGTNGDGTRKENVGRPLPKIANPGNVLPLIVKAELSFERVLAILTTYGHITRSRPSEILRSLRQALSQNTAPQWFSGAVGTVLGSEILQQSLLGAGKANTSADSLSELPEGVSAGECRDQVLQSGVCGIVDGNEARGDLPQRKRPGNGSQEDGEGCLLKMRTDGSSSGASSGRGHTEQCPGEPSSPVPLVSQTGTCQASGDLSDLWAASEEVQSLWTIVRHALPALQEVWRSSSVETQGRPLSACIESPELMRLIVKARVGGGHMGSRLAHLNEAPYPENLCEFFIQCFSPPGGIVADCFSGSGTTAAMCKRHGRSFTGCDLRQSQVNLGLKRLAQEQRLMFTSEDG